MRQLFYAVLATVLLLSATPAWALTDSQGWVIEGEPLFRLSFVDAEHGVGIQDELCVVFTANGGASWSTVSLSPYLDDAERLVGACWSDDTHLWALGDWATLLTSDDTGATWHQVALPVGPLYSGHTLYFANPLDGWAAFESGGTNLRTVDGGATWEAVDIETSPGVPMWISRFAFSGANGVAAGPESEIAYTPDGGDTWESAECPVNSAIYDVEFRTPTEVWAAGSAGLMLRSTDAGANWEVVAPLAAIDLMDIEWIDSDVGIAGGSLGMVVQTNDGGATWHLRSVPGDAGVASVQSLASAGATAWAGLYDRTLSNATPGVISEAPVEFAIAGGWERAESAVRLSQSQFSPGEPEAVVITGYDTWADALCAAPLATAYGGPILLSPPWYGPHSPEEYALHAEIERLDPQEVIILGGPVAVPDWLDAHLRAEHTGVTVRRIAGDDRYETSALVLEEIVAKREAEELPLSDTVYFTTGDAPADALAVGPVAAREGSPVLLANRDSVPGATWAAFTDYHPANTVLLGGTVRISAELESDIDALAWTQVTRVGGIDRHDTAAMLAQRAVSEYGFQWDRVLVCRGNEPWDALAAGPVQAARTAPLLLLEIDRVGPDASIALSLHADEIERIQVAGGWIAVPPQRLLEIENLF